MSERKERREKPFKGLKVYFSNSIKGEMGGVEDIGQDVVRFLADNGADVLSENVAYLKPEEGLPIFERRTGIDLTQITEPVERAKTIREVDIDWVDEATHLIAIVNGASYGVGVELQRALDKPKMGMNKTPILCLVHQSRLEKLSSMVRGIDAKKEESLFELTVYEAINEVKDNITDFLSRNR
jgi:hypothetical protein